MHTTGSTQCFFCGVGDVRVEGDACEVHSRCKAGAFKQQLAIAGVALPAHLMGARARRRRWGHRADAAGLGVWVDLGPRLRLVGCVMCVEGGCAGMWRCARAR
jgi:hypothetical protein